MRNLLVPLLLLGAGAAGCLSSDGGDGDDGGEDGQGDVSQVFANGTIDHATVAALIGEPIAMDHDHTDATQHVGSHNVEFVSWSSLGVELGQNGFANFVLREEGDRTLA